ncbi:uncharacterized protein M6G45_003599 [Spheniscus humboldti]
MRILPLLCALLLLMLQGAADEDLRPPPYLLVLAFLSQLHWAKQPCWRGGGGGRKADPASTLEVLPCARREPADVLESLSRRLLRDGRLSLARGLPQDCERRGGFCSHGSCPPGIGRVGICSEQDFCCRRRWYP